jgi:hypothetical protein
MHRETVKQKSEDAGTFGCLKPEGANPPLAG